MLHRNNLSPQEIVDARKEALAGEDAWRLLANAKEIVVASGKKYLSFDPKSNSKEDILKQTLGRTGTLRAPTLLIGDRLLVGYCDALYAQFLG
ncbi:MAG: hypothetical protein JZU50_04600 [Desulfobulbaceae bacterium]|nr:hypothetical protein [Desulfobulbaceae bacterium]